MLVFPGYPLQLVSHLHICSTWTRAEETEVLIETANKNAVAFKSQEVDLIWSILLGWKAMIKFLLNSSREDSVMNKVEEKKDFKLQ